MSDTLSTVGELLIVEVSTTAGASFLAFAPSLAANKFLKGLTDTTVLGRGLLGLPARFCLLAASNGLITGICLGPSAGLRMGFGVLVVVSSSSNVSVVVLIRRPLLGFVVGLGLGKSALDVEVEATVELTSGIEVVEELSPGALSSLSSAAYCKHNALK